MCCALKSDHFPACLHAAVVKALIQEICRRLSIHVAGPERVEVELPSVGVLASEGKGHLALQPRPELVRFCRQQAQVSMPAMPLCPHVMPAQFIWQQLDHSRMTCWQQAVIVVLT